MSSGLGTRRGAVAMFRLLSLEALGSFGLWSWRDLRVLARDFGSLWDDDIFRTILDRIFAMVDSRALTTEILGAAGSQWRSTSW